MVDVVLDHLPGHTGDALHGGAGAAVVLVEGLVERHEEGSLDLGLPPPEGLQIHLKLVRQLLVGGGVAVLPGEALARSCDVAALAPDRARYVVRAAQLVQNGAANPGGGEGAEREAA